MTVLKYRTGKSGLFALASMALASLAMGAQAQNDNGAATETYIAIVKGNDVYVRCGAAESYYPFTKLKDGDFVKVTGSKFEWSRVVTAGPAFDEAFGYIKYGKAETGRFRLAGDKNSGVTLGKTDVIAPNLDSKNNPKESWKAIVRLDADQTLRVLDVSESEKDVILKVALPDSATGWVSTAYLEPATPEQSKQWTENLATWQRAKAEDAKKAAQTASTKNNEKPASAPPPAESSTTNTGTETASLPEPAFVPVESEPATAVPTMNVPEPTVTAAPPKKDEPKLPTWNDLEAALKRLQREAIETAEVTPLRELYLDLAQRSANDARISKYALGRADQLQVWADLQQKRNEVDAARQRAKMSVEEAIAVQKALESSAEYVAVGRVAASTIYDGTNLPKLLRLQDAATGRTIAYLQPDEEYQVVNLIGNLVGIVGEKHYDGGMRLNIVEPKRIDLLLPEERQATVPTDQPRP